MRFTRLLAPAMAATVLATSAGAQQIRSGTVRAVVHDSLSGRPLSGATVQLVSLTDREFIRTADTDSLGRLDFHEIPVGRYRVGFMHPVLDELGVTAPDREVNVEGDRTNAVELSVPSAARLKFAVCGPRAGADSSVAMVGTVRDPRDRMPVAGAAVSGQWMEISVGPGGIQQRFPKITATTGTNGWFALCNLPSGVVSVLAKRGTDSTPPIDMTLDAGNFRRRDLFLSAPGTAELRGKVVTADSTRPLTGARVTVIGGPQVEAGATGEWRFAAVPLGTQMLEIRAVGYFPERRVIDVVAEAPPVQVALKTFQAMLDAVRVTAERTTPADGGGFAARARRSGMGRYLTAEQIARRNVLETSDLLKTLPGFVGDGSLNMRSNFSDGAGSYGVACAAEVYVDGHLMRGISAAELDAIVKPESIHGLEVYSAGSPKPPQFDSGMSGCGSLVIWQVPLHQRRRR